MRFKLDENFGARTQRVFREAGHDVRTAREEELQGSTDEVISSVCAAEERCLVTLDLDFADTIRFPPHRSAGIVVIRLPRNPSLSLLESLVRQFLDTVADATPERNLWVVEVGRIRMHQPEDGPDD